ncbi:hypothetical protein ACFPA8_04930 [Streptomyces ovatisporus]|uniref:Uncharacterized protein n=1 Tax=Streptomyces ovatisporus TaxID=1128682 RepID=A0ABV9A0I2_9ACTN
MAPPPRRPQPPAPAELPDGLRQALLQADPALGRLHAPEETCAGLRRLGYAARHGRTGGTHLTLAGWDVRAELSGTPRTDTTAFTPATGHEALDDGQVHARTAERAWASLLEIRRVTAEDMGLPAEWERQRPLHAVSLALQASGLPPAAIGSARRCLRSGYQVSRGPAAPRSVRVDWRQRPGSDDPSPREGLATCQDVLAARGWSSDQYLDARHRPYLVAGPHNETAPLL